MWMVFYYHNANKSVFNWNISDLETKICVRQMGYPCALWNRHVDHSLSEPFTLFLFSQMLIHSGPFVLFSTRIYLTFCNILMATGFPTLYVKTGMDTFNGSGRTFELRSALNSDRLNCVIWLQISEKISNLKVVKYWIVSIDWRILVYFFSHFIFFVLQYSVLFIISINCSLFIQ